MPPATGTTRPPSGSSRSPRPPFWRGSACCSRSTAGYLGCTSALDFRQLLRFRDLLDCYIQVARIGETSITYDFQIWRDEELCVEAEVVAVLLAPDGDTAEWTQDQRDLLLSAGPQAAELLTVS